MATQGILSITKNRKVLLKVVVGSDGYNLYDLAREIRQRDLYDDPKAIWKLCDEVNVGSMVEGRFVLFDEGRQIVGADEGIEVPDLYASTFDDPYFNPRWELGSASYCVIDELHYQPTQTGAQPC